MAALTRRTPVIIAAVCAMATIVWLLSCGKLVGLNAPVTPLARIHVQVTGDVTPLIPSRAADRAPELRAALVWGKQWQPEPLCVLPAASDAAAVVLKAGCPDNFGFVPNLDAADAVVAPDGNATFELMNAPSADVMVGDITARVVYASVYVYDDRNGNGTLDFNHQDGFRGVGGGGPGEGEGGQGGGGTGVPSADAGPSPDNDIIYGASFISMTLPDQRLAFSAIAP